MASPGLLLRNTFAGDGSPDWDEWPNTEWPAAAGVNPAGWARPCVDGKGKGIPSRALSALWRGRSSYMPGRPDYQARLWCRWRNPAGAAQREVGVIVRFLDAQNFLVARLRSMGSASPQLRLFQVVAGVETQRGSTYSGSDLDAGDLLVGVRWTVRVEDKADGTTRVTVYVGGGSADDAWAKGTSRIDWTGDVGTLRGSHGVGVEINATIGGTDVYLDDLEVYDLADEWNPSGGLGDGSGWTLVFGGADARSVADLIDLTTQESRLTRLVVRQAYGTSGNRLTIGVNGDWREGPVLKPGVRVQALHDGIVRFYGTIANGQLSTDGHSQTWTALDAAWAARQVVLQADDGSATLYWNVADRESDYYDASLQGKTVGQVLKALFDRCLDGASNSLRFYGAAPVVDAPYVQTELDALDAVIPDLALSGSFDAAVATLLRYMPKFAVWVDPTTLVWHFRDVTALAAQDVSLTSGHVQATIVPDRDKSYSFVRIRGAKKEKKVSSTYSSLDGSLPKAWTSAQEGTTKKGKRHLGTLSGTIVAAGMGTLDGVTRPYFDILARDGVDEDDWRGAVVSYVGSDDYARWVWKNTGTRFWLSSPAWSPTPSPGDRYYLGLVHPDAIPGLSAMGVGRAFFFPPVSVCGYASAYGAGVRYNGLCGKAQVRATGDDGVVYSQEYQYRVYAMTAAQQAAGFCDPLVVISERPKPPLALINFMAQMNPGGSPPTSDCVSGNTNAFSRMPQVDVQIQVSENEDDAPSLREPSSETAFEGEAYEDWDCRQGFVVDDPNFTDMDQEPGLRKAAAAILALLKQKAYSLTVRIASPWKGVTGDHPTPAATSIWAGLSKRVTLSSSLRATGFESASGLMEFAVEWDVPGNATTLEVGTAAGWLAPEWGAVSKAFSEARVLKKALQAIGDLEAYRNSQIGHGVDRVAGMQGGPVDGCDVTVVNQNTHNVKNVEEDDQNKEAWLNHLGLRQKLFDAIFGGAVEDENPGAQIGTPGYDGAEGKQVVDGPVLQSHAQHDVPFQGPAAGRNGARGRFGGMLETDRTLSGSPPQIVSRRGGFLFRKKQSVDGRTGGAEAMEFAVEGPDGQALGGWSAIARPSQLTGGGYPLSRLAAGSVPQQIHARTQELADRMGAVETSRGRLVAPGEVTTEYPDGAPAGLPEVVRAGGGLLGPYFQPVPQSFSDPGGLVFEGPMTPDGASAGLYWRVHPTALLPVRVAAATPGTGTNGGAWDWETGGPGGSMEYLRAGYTVHKQAHTSDFAQDRRYGVAPLAMSDSPLCAFGQEGRVLPKAAKAGVAMVLSMPPGARGTLAITAHVKEDANGPAEATTGKAFALAVYTAYRSSPWTAVGATAYAGVGSSDGSNTATAFNTWKVGGSVPSGLRKPFDLAVSVIRDPANGADTSAADAVVTGIDVEVAVVEGGYLIRWTEALDASDAVLPCKPMPVEYLNVQDGWRIHPGKAIPEALDLTDDWRVEGAAPVEAEELLEVADAIELTPS